MKRIGLLAPAALALLLGGCHPSWGPSWNRTSQPAAPGDSLTVRRVMGQDPDAPPLREEAGRWARRERPRATLADPDAVVPGARPDSEAPPPRMRGSSLDPAGLPGVAPIATAAPARAEAPLLPAGAARREGTVIAMPGGQPAVVTGGTPYYQTYQQANAAGGGVIIPQGNGMGTVIGPDGRVTSVPMPR